MALQIRSARPQARQGLLLCVGALAAPGAPCWGAEGNGMGRKGSSQGSSR